MNTVIYARYSAGPRQTDQSIEGQLRVCTDFCKQRGLTVIDTYCDRHISGRTDEPARVPKAHCRRQAAEVRGGGCL